MALLARALRRSGLFSSVPVYLLPARSRDICAGLARAKPELPPPQWPSRIAEGLTMSRSAVETGPGVAGKSPEHISAGTKSASGLDPVREPVLTDGTGLRASLPGLCTLVPDRPLGTTWLHQLRSFSNLRPGKIWGHAFSSFTKTESGTHQVLDLERKLTSLIRGHSFSNFTQTVPSCPQTLDPERKPQPLTQLVFINQKEMDNEQWETPIEYLRKNSVYHPSSDPTVKPLMRQFFRDLIRKLVVLVYRNRILGYDISDSLTLDNLLVSPTYNAFVLKEAIYTSTATAVKFTGYKAAAKVTKEILESVYGKGVVDELADDLGYVLKVLECDDISDKLNIYNAAFLNTTGRISLSLKIDMFLSHDLWLLPLSKKKGHVNRRELAATFMRNLHYVSAIPDDYPTDKMHPEFKEKRDHSHELREKLNLASQSPSPSPAQPGPGQQAQTLGAQQHQAQQKRAQTAQGAQSQLKPGPGQQAQPQGAQQHQAQAQSQQAQAQQSQVQAQSAQPQLKSMVAHYKKITGRWLVSLNRHCIMHPKGLQEDAVEMLHMYMPLYLPKAQEEIIYADVWDYFKIEDMFPAASVDF